MAYMTINGNGPYPNKAGEYCDNHYPGGMACARNGQTHEQAQEEQRAWLRDKRLGQPRPTASYTTEQLEAMGMVGLYLMMARKSLPDGATEVPTPPELMEPEPPAGDRTLPWNR
jgi:hypothetical protein